MIRLDRKTRNEVYKEASLTVYNIYYIYIYIYILCRWKRLNRKQRFKYEQMAIEEINDNNSEQVFKKASNRQELFLT